MKILHVITSLATGGAEKLMVDLLPRMKQADHKVELCVFDGTRTPFFEQLEKMGIKIHWFHKGGSVYNPLNIYRLWCLMRKGHYNIVHTHNTAPQLFAAVASVLCSVVLVTTEHTTSNRRRDWKWYAWLDRWMYSRYKTIISISDKTQENLFSYLKCFKEKMCIIYNGIDVAKYANAKPLINSTRKIITAVAGFRYQKDQDTLIKAMSLLPKEEYELWLVGDGERRPVLEKLVKDLSLCNTVKFMGIRADIPEILKSSDVVVMSSHWEGFGLAAIEGMAAKKPVIATDIPGIAQVVENAGVLFPHENADQLAKEIKHLCKDTGYYNEVACKCMKRAADYNIQKMVNAYLHVYESLATR